MFLFLTTIFTTPVRLMTRTLSKRVRRFLWAGRVVMKKLERATQQKLDMVKERKESRNPTVGNALEVVVAPVTVGLGN